MTRRDPSERADRLRTLLVFTVLQAFLLTVNLHLLPMSAGEAIAVNCVTRPAREILRFVRADFQPPLYFLVAHAWLKLTGAEDPLWALRLLSALYAICATVLLDRLWLRKVEAETRQWVILLWTFSPCMMLFGRMAQAYALQALLTIVAIRSLLRFVDDSASWKRLAALAASLAALLYTDYLAGVAIWGGANVLLLMGVRSGHRPVWRTWLLPNVLVAAALHAVDGGAGGRTAAIGAQIYLQSYRQRLPRSRR